MSDVVLDANVLVGLLDQNDSLHQRATELLGQMQHRGDQPVMLDVMVAETVSALCRRATQRKSAPPNLGRVRDQIHEWLEDRRLPLHQLTQVVIPRLGIFRWYTAPEQYLAAREGRPDRRDHRSPWALQAWR